MKYQNLYPQWVCEVQSISHEKGYYLDSMWREKGIYRVILLE